MCIRDSDERGLRDGRVEHAFWAEAVDEPGGGGEDAAVGADVLAHHEDGLVSGHPLTDRLPHGLRGGELALAGIRFYCQRERLVIRGQRGGHEFTPSAKT